MKIELLIAPYLFSHKTLSLQDIGTFHLNQDIIMPAESDKEYVLPENAVSFEYDPRASKDEQFILYIMEQTRKIRPLATSDLESFTMLGKQFMNIGKPLILEGLGLLMKNQQGHYEFKQGTSFLNRAESQTPQLKEKESTEIDFSAPRRKKSNKGWLAGVIVIVIASALGVLFYTLRNRNKEMAEKPVPIMQDTLPAKPDSALAQNQPLRTDSVSAGNNKTDSFSFKVVIREYDNQAMADKKLAQFKTYGHKLIQVPVDSTHILLAMPFMNPLSDTGRIRDSLKVLFGGNAYIKIN